MTKEYLKIDMIESGKTFSYIKERYLKNHKLSIISKPQIWYFILNAQGNPRSGLAITALKNDSYTLIAEDIKIEHHEKLKNTRVKEITSFFSFDSIGWTADLATLLQAAIKDMKSDNVVRVVMFTHKTIYEYTKKKLGINIFLLQPLISRIDSNIVIERLKIKYGDRLNYIEEEEYIKRDSARGVYFDIMQS